jgi:apolipoprotein N-acyltransferase
MEQYGGMSRTLSILGIIILAAFLSLFTGAAGSLIKQILKNNPSSPWSKSDEPHQTTQNEPAVHNKSFGSMLLHPFRTALGFSDVRSSSQAIIGSPSMGPAGGILSFLLIPFIWVAKDLVVEKIFGGFPWCSAGYSQYTNIYFVQIAEWGGIHLLTFIVIYFNVLIYLLLTRRRKHILAVILISVFCIYTVGYFLYQSDAKANKELPFHTAGILQPNTRNDQVFSLKQKYEKLDEFFSDSKALAAKGAEFVIWPEFTISLYPLQNKYQYNRFEEFVEEHVPVLAGFTDLKGSNEIYNSLILFEEGKYQKYDKVHLTPFGEYILFRELLFFVKRITDEIGDFTPGKEVHNLVLDGHALAAPICYELIFPELVREFIHKGGEAIIIASNDSWYGDTSAPYQLLAMSTLRSIENRRYILRSTTNGISAVIGSSGEILYQSPFDRKDTFVAKFKYIKRETVFTRFGYLFPYFCIIFLLAYFIKQKFLGVQNPFFKKGFGRRRLKKNKDEKSQGA